MPEPRNWTITVDLVDGQNWEAAVASGGDYGPGGYEAADPYALLAAVARDLLAEVLHYPTHEPSRGAYKQAIEVARDLLCEEIRDPEHEAHPEYTRGVVNLIADLFGVHEMDVGTRMDQVAEDIGLKVRYEQ